MNRASQQKIKGDYALWFFAFLGSLILNLCIFTLLIAHSILFSNANFNELPEPLLEESIVIIPPSLLQQEKQPPSKQTAVRTSEDQRSETAPENTSLIGERNTRATSDAPPVAETPQQPSQQGRKPRENESPETTNSQYQDGKLTELAPPQAPSSPPTSSTTTPENQQSASSSRPQTETREIESKTSEREKFFTGPDPIEQEVEKSRQTKRTSGPKPVEKSGQKIRELSPQQQNQQQDGKLSTHESTQKPESKNSEKVTKTPTPAQTESLDDPAFRGNQAKTRILGSLSRTGRSALDVADTALGRYQAKIARAIEREWQRNCIKHRDFIVPGYIVVRFIVNQRGHITNVEFIGDIEGGAIQKGFTLDAIRKAPIPPMTRAIKRDTGGESLELTFSFYF